MHIALKLKRDKYGSHEIDRKHSTATIDIHDAKQIICRYLALDHEIQLNDDKIIIIGNDDKKVLIGNNECTKNVYLNDKLYRSISEKSETIAKVDIDVVYLPDLYLYGLTYSKYNIFYLHYNRTKVYALLDILRVKYLRINQHEEFLKYLEDRSTKTRIKFENAPEEENENAPIQGKI